MNTQNPQGRESHIIWQGLLEWIEKAKNATMPDQKIAKHVPCQVSAHLKDGEPELYVFIKLTRLFHWDPLIVHLEHLPRTDLSTLNGLSPLRGRRFVCC